MKYFLIIVTLFVTSTSLCAQNDNNECLTKGINLFKQKLYREAADCYKECKERHIHGNKYELSSYLFLCYCMLEDHHNAIKYGEETKSLYVQNDNNDVQKFHSQFLVYLGKEYYNLGQYEKAIGILSETLEIQKNVLGKEHPLYAENLNNLALYNSSLGKYSEAVRFGTEALKIQEKTLGKENSDYATSLGNLALYNCYLGKYSEAIRLGTQTLKIQGKVLGKEHPDYATSLGNLALYNSNIGNYSDAIRYVRKALKIQEKVLGKENYNYVINLSNLALYNANLGNYSEAIRLGNEALQIEETVQGTDHPDYAAILANLAAYNYSCGNVLEAIRLGTEALHRIEVVLGKEHPYYATTLHSIANYNSSLGNYFEAIRIGTEALRIRERILGKEHHDYAVCLSSLASYNFKLGNYSEAIRLDTEALQIEEKVLGKQHPEYAVILSNLANDYIGIENYTEAIRLGEEALKITDFVLGKEHHIYLSTISNISVYHWYKHDFYSMHKSLVETFSLEQKCIIPQYLFMTSLEQYFYSSEIKSKFIKDYAYSAKNISELQEVNYDALLLTKNLNLNNLRDRQDIIAESGDSTLIKLYDDIKLNKLILTKQLEKPIKQRYLNTDSLYNVIQQQERELALKSKEYGDFMKSLSITHKDIKSKLEKDDIAIEFVEAQLPKSDTIVYYALTLRNDYDAPRLIPLFNKKDFDEQAGSDSTYDSLLTKFVWTPLSEELKGVKNIYFSPSGILYKLNLENLPSIDGNGMMSDKHNLFRLSSTRELALDRADKESKHATVYGGIQYSADEANVSVLEANARLYASINRSDENLYNPYIDSLGVSRDDRKDPNKGRYLPSLPNAKVEANTVTKTINDAHIKDFTATVFTDTAATEASFKALSGQKKRLIHIATHGFYYKEADSLKYKDFMPQMFLDERNKHRYVEDKQLTRSGLYFAGADNRRLGKKIPDGVDDGILTAQEISMLDLRGCDLVVLSACQTAQGDLGADGVFGLQRAFKKAGVNSILMSIDKIDDRATQLLMTEFYKNYVKGVSKQESLKRAQKYLREETEYKDAKYWSSFILLDALD